MITFCNFWIPKVEITHGDSAKKPLANRCDRQNTLREGKGFNPSVKSLKFLDHVA